nr:hypothetical protein [Mycoplasmopsis bovis]
MTKFLISLSYLKSAAAWIETRAKNSYDELFELKDGKAYFKYNKDKTVCFTCSRIFEKRI